MNVKPNKNCLTKYHCTKILQHFHGVFIHIKPLVYSMRAKFSLNVSSVQKFLVVHT